MRRSLVRVVLALGALGLLAGLTPGTSADPLATRPTASIDVREVVAGSRQPLVLTVTNPLGSLGVVTTVRLGVTADVFAFVASADVPGWTADVADGFLTFTATGAGILPATSTTFGFEADALRPASDRDALWSVRTSTTGVPSRTMAATPSAPGALGTRVRTLEILDVTPTAPAQVVGDDPLIVSTGQDNVVIDVQVRNAGSAAQSATVTLGGADTTSAPAAATIPAGEVATVPVTVAFGATYGDSQLAATAVADGSNAVGRAIPYTAQPSMQLEPDFFDPQELAPGIVRRPRPWFRVTAVHWSPYVFLDQHASQIDIGDGLFVSHLHRNTTTDEPITINEWCCQSVLAADGFTLPEGLPDGPIGATVHLVGTDENGAAFDVTLEYPDVRVDRRVPDGDLRLELADDAPGDDEVYRLRGSLHQEGEGCGYCRLTHRHGVDGFAVYDAAGALLDVLWVNDNPNGADGAAVPGSWVADDGQVFGVWGIAEWPEGGVSFRWVTRVVDPSGLSRELASPLYPIDQT